MAIEFRLNLDHLSRKKQNFYLDTNQNQQKYLILIHFLIAYHQNQFVYL